MYRHASRITIVGIKPDQGALPMAKAHDLRTAATEFRAEAARTGDANIKASLQRLADNLERLAELREFSHRLQTADER
jgi:hypothetical protein